MKAKLRLPDIDDRRTDFERYGRLSIRERAALLVAACDVAAFMFLSRSAADQRRILETREPLPASSRAALSRLRALARR